MYRGIKKLSLLGALTLLFLVPTPTPLFALLNSTPSFYVSPSELPPTLLVNPPAQDSPLEQQQVEQVITFQSHTKLSEFAQLKNEQHMRLELMTQILGPSFNREHLPRTFLLLDHVLSDARDITEKDKDFWHIKRPYLLDKRVQLRVDPIDSSPSYPSGHTSESLVLAEVLGMLAPQHREALRGRADEIAQHRIEAGVHTPLDVQAGRALAMQIVGALMANKDFQQDLLIARHELDNIP